MPIFEYRCNDCKGFFEELVRSSEKIDCPACGSGNIVRKPSVCGFATSSGFASSAGSNCSGCKAHSCSGCR